MLIIWCYPNEIQYVEGRYTGESGSVLVGYTVDNHKGFGTLIRCAGYIIDGVPDGFESHTAGGGELLRLNR